MRAIFTGDWHLTDRVSDEYRWAVIPYLIKLATRKKVDAIIVTGDLTEFKDKHSSRLVQRLMDGLWQLAQVAPVYIVKGNHDYVDVDSPFFSFTRLIDRIHFYVDPEMVNIAGDAFLFLPHAKDPGHEWAKYKKLMKKADFIVMHQPVYGAVGANGFKLDSGYRAQKRLTCADTTKVISGDIHTPQRVGKVLYVGSPHPVDFGDDFQPRTVYWDGTSLKSIKRTTIRKASLTIRNIEELTQENLGPGDMAKVTVKLPRSRFDEWEDLRVAIMEAAGDMGFLLAGVELKESVRHRLDDEPEETSSVSPSEVVEQFAHSQRLDGYTREVGIELVSR